MKLEQALTRKLGPLPAWAWLAVLAGALLAFRRFWPGAGGGAAAGDTGSSTDSGGGSLDAGALDGGGGGGLPLDQGAPVPGSSTDLQPPPVVYDPPTDGYPPGPSEGGYLNPNDFTVAQLVSLGQPDLYGNVSKSPFSDEDTLALAHYFGTHYTADDYNSGRVPGFLTPDQRNALYAAQWAKDHPATATTTTAAASAKIAPAADDVSIYSTTPQRPADTSGRQQPRTIQPASPAPPVGVAASTPAAEAALAAGRRQRAAII